MNDFLMIDLVQKMLLLIDELPLGHVDPTFDSIIIRYMNRQESRRGNILISTNQWAKNEKIKH